jgi:hypothetical protein
MKNKTIFSFLFGLIIIPCVFSVPLENLVSPEIAARLRSNSGLVMEMQLRNPSLVLMPENSDLQQFTARIINNLNPNMMVETLYLYRKPEHSHIDPGNWDEVQKTGIYNQLLALSTLTGIQYYSASRGSIRTFFEYSNVIDGPENRIPVPDPVYSIPPAFLSLYVRQKDLTFGDNIYRYEYVVARDTVFFVQENLTPLSVTVIPAIGKGNLRTILAIFDCGDLLLVYSVSMARAFLVPGMGERIGVSFSNRAEAILKWFSGRADMFFSAN